MQKTMKEMSEEQALGKLQSLCSRSEHCSFDMRRKMLQWGLGEDVQQRILDKLKKGRYVDDERFALAFVHDKVNYSKWGRRKVDQALMMRHISEDIRRKALGSIEEESYTDTLLPLLRTKMKSIKAKSDYDMYCRLIRFGVGRGYEIDEIKECLQKLTDCSLD